VGRVIVVLFATAALTAACGGSHTSGPNASTGTTLVTIMHRPGPDVAITAGASEFVPGEVRFPFLVINNEAESIERPTASVWVAQERDRKPFERVTAPLQPIGIPGRSAAAFGGVRKIYVAHMHIPRPGRYWLVAQPTGAKIQALGTLDVTAQSTSTAVGAKAPRSATPTVATAPAAAITTSRPPDLPLLRYSVAQSLAAHKPFVVTFATPKFCTSRLCGPVVDVMEAVRKQFASRGVRFIHVEVYRGNNPQRGYNQWMQQWGLLSEPWVFLVGSDGRVKAKFEGSISEAELAAAVRRKLL
jgi:hypothetical protein